MATDYTLNQNGLPIIEANNNDISFMLYNKGGYSQTYMYNLFDTGTSDLPMFQNQSGQITLDAEQSYELNFNLNNAQSDETTLEFSIWPVRNFSISVLEILIQIYKYTRCSSQFLSGEHSPTSK